MSPYTYQWNNSFNFVTSNQYTVNSTSSVQVIVKDALGCTSPYSTNAVIPIIGDISFTTNSIGASSYCGNSILDPIHFLSNITGDYTSVLWDFGDGTVSNDINPEHIYINPNDYYLITLTVTYPFGCVYIKKAAISVSQGYLLIVPDAFTPNKIDGVNDTIRPIAKCLKNIHLDIYDTWGSLIYSEVGDVLKGWDGKIKGITSENGNYYLKVSAETFYGTVINENHPFVLIK
jgi:gliding motility-associated-like protein